MSVENGAGGILVTGATGNVGSEVCRHLSRVVGVAVFGAVRRLRDGLDERLHGAAQRVFDFTDPATWASALEGVDRIFLMRPPHTSNIKRDMRPFLAFARERGIEQVVFLSVQGAEDNPIVPHHKVEHVVRELELPFTFLRPSFFMQNLTTTHLPEIRDEHRIFVPAGTGKTNFIDVRDIGAAAATVLTESRGGGSANAHRADFGRSHIGCAYTLTGEENLTYREVADRLTRILGIPIRYESARLAPFIRYQLKQERSIGHALVMYALYSVTRMGKAGGATSDFEEIVGRNPRSLDEFIQDHRAILAGSPAR